MISKETPGLFYFAYDLHLDRGRMAACCPTAKPRFSASLPNFQLIFAGWSREWHGPVATIKRAGREKVLGGVYEIGETDLAKLDREHGFPAASDRIKVTVFKDTEKRLKRLPIWQSRRGRQTSHHLIT